jgi:uncharacterized protein
MSLRTVCYLLPLLPVSLARAQTVPLVDHHQHLFSAATVALVSPKPLAPVDLPPALDSLVRARGRAAQDRAALRNVYTDGAVLMHFDQPGWIRGRDSVAAWWIRSTPAPLHLTPVGWEGTVSEGQIAAYLTQGRGDSARHVGHVLLSVRRTARAGWRIATETVTPGPASIDPISATDLVAMLDAAGIRRAVVLAMGYTWGSPNRNVENEYEKVKIENDWTSQQVARFPDRLRAFCSFNPLRPYALDELARCAKDPQLRFGLKLHFGNSVVDYHNPEHIEQLRRVFRAANDRRMPIVIHMRSSFSRRLPYGAKEARIFLDSLLPSAPDVVVQIAHLAGGGDYDDTAADEAMGVLAEAAASRDPRATNLYVDVSGAVGPRLGIPVETADRMAKHIRRFGVDRVLFGSDAATGGNLPPREAWAAFRQLPLTDEEFRTIAANVAPYMR